MGQRQSERHISEIFRPAFPSWPFGKPGSQKGIGSCRGVSGSYRKDRGSLTDHYDPRTNIIRLSDSVCDRTSTAAIGVAAHEAGHAIQYAQGYLPIKIRNAIIPVTNIGSRLAIPLILIGLLFAGEGGGLGNLAYLGVLCFGLSTLFQLITLPVEFDASRRALHALENTHILTGEELYGARKVLTAAALTYVAALAVSLTQLFRLLTIVNRRNGRR